MNKDLDLLELSEEDIEMLMELNFFKKMGKNISKAAHKAGEGMKKAAEQTGKGLEKAGNFAIHN